MRRVSRLGIAFAVALLVVGLAAPASAKKGGNPGPPSGSGLEVTVDSSGFMTANSAGDRILFDITIANTVTGLLYTAVSFDSVSDMLANCSPAVPNSIAGGDSWTGECPYIVAESDLSGLPPVEGSSVTVGTVTAEGWLDVSKSGRADAVDSDGAVMKAYPVPPCPTASDPVPSLPPSLSGVEFGPNADYSVCSFTVDQPSYWMLSTKLPKRPHGQAGGPSATVRDGVPGNWCSFGSSDTYQLGSDWYVDDYMEFPADGVCLGGGAGGDTIDVRNHTIFYLATWAGNVVEKTTLCTLKVDDITGEITLVCP